MSSNYSLYAIPAFYVLALVPTAYGTSAIVKARNGKHNNVSPRGQAALESIKKTVPKDTFEFFERSKAAHYNSLENFPLFASAVICGNMARLDAQTLNIASGAFLGLRTAYLVAYIGITDNRLSYVRSALWMMSVGVCCYLLGKAGHVWANGGSLFFALFNLVRYLLITVIPFVVTAVASYVTPSKILKLLYKASYPLFTKDQFLQEVPFTTFLVL